MSAKDWHDLSSNNSKLDLDESNSIVIILITLEALEKLIILTMIFGQLWIVFDKGLILGLEGRD